MGFVKVRGISFYYDEKGEGLPILLIPPSGSTASTWGAFFGYLARVGRVIAYDRRGYSRSGGKTVHSASEHTADAAAILEALEASPAVAVGTSAGAAIALRLAVRRPDLVLAAVLHESPWRALRHPSAPALGTLARMEWQARRGRYAEATETLLRFVYAYRDGGSAWDQFPEEWRRTAKENGKSVIADLESTILGYPPPKGPGEDHRTVRVHVWLTKPELHAPHHTFAGPGHPDGNGA
jgi:pimeloyl-ACP methyl ester carboxylesterase